MVKTNVAAVTPADDTYHRESPCCGFPSVKWGVQCYTSRNDVNAIVFLQRMKCKLCGKPWYYRLSMEFDPISKEYHTIEGSI
jgi:hypothetical protein